MKVLAFSYSSNRHVTVALDGTSLQEYPINTGGPQGVILPSTYFLLYIINDPFDDVTCNIAINANDITLQCKFYLAYEMWQHRDLAPKHEADLKGTTARVRM